MSLTLIRCRSRDGVPADLRGRGRPDRMMAVLEGFVDRYLGTVTRFDYDPAHAGHNPNSAMTLVVTDRRIVARDENVAALTFAAVGGGEVPAWQPGCHLDFHLPSGLRRQYSLCGDPADRRHYTIAVRAIPDGGGGSVEMHALEPGTTVTVRGPRNGFPFVAGGGALFVAGGIGITPILPMVRQARLLGMDWQFVYSGRSRETMPFLEEIESWDEDRVFVRTDAEHGLPAPSDLLGRAVPGGAVYCCGPAPMLEAVRTHFPETSATALHLERFGAPTVLDGTEFEVELAHTGEVLTVPADRSALDVIRGRLPGVGYSCQQGFCGTCRVRVLAGTPQHRATRLSPAEQDEEMLLCVSRSDDGDRLVLDL
ncbi:PDR/VanB family oxidoreductase [Rhodococcus sp. NPDC003318]|uniref:PDR/VanB family oxidoreductase n=1 Tax=Rhodococcus sp. NPDC003318 TaxID=3364503 RepID=UPI003682E4C9